MTQSWPKPNPNLQKKESQSWRFEAINLVAYPRWRTSANQPRKGLLIKSEEKQMTGRNILDAHKRVWRSFTLETFSVCELLCKHTHTHTHTRSNIFFPQLIYSEIYLESQCRENNRILSNGQASLTRNLKVQNATDCILQHSPVKEN